VRLQNFVESDDVFVSPELAKEKDLTKGSLCIRGVRKGVENLLQRNGPLRFAIEGLPNNTVGLRTVRAVSYTEKCNA
jgi:hypothetical protein